MCRSSSFSTCLSSVLHCKEGLSEGVLSQIQVNKGDRSRPVEGLGACHTCTLTSKFFKLSTLSMYSLFMSTIPQKSGLQFFK